MHFPTHRPDPRNEPGPVGKENKDEDRSEKPERLLNQVRANDALEEPGEALHEPFKEILRPARYPFHAPCRELREKNDPRGHYPGHHHGIRDRKSKRPRDLNRVLRNAMSFTMSRVRGRARE